MTEQNKLPDEVHICASKIMKNRFENNGYEVKVGINRRLIDDTIGIKIEQEGTEKPDAPSSLQEVEDPMAVDYAYIIPNKTEFENQWEELSKEHNKEK